MLTRRLLTRIALIAGAVVVAAAVLVLGFGIGRDRYTITAQFTDAGQLVKGGTVQVGGRVVGTIADIRLSDDGLADVEMQISDEQVEPLTLGTKAQIRTLGLSGVANRYIDLLPGPEDAPAIADGGRIQLASTTGIVDLDQVLTALDPSTRERLRSLIRSGGKLFEGTAAQDGNRTLRYLNPAFAETRALTAELTADKKALATLIGTGSQTARTLAQHDQQLGELLDGSAGTLQALADRRGALDSTLAQAPGSMRRIRTSLDQIAGTFDGLTPTFDELSDASPAVVSLLRELPRSTQALQPVLRDLRRTLPSLNTTLRRLPGLETITEPSLGSATSAIGEATPIFRGLRPYTPDLVGGLFNGFGGTAGNSYDANGHVARIALTTGGAALTGLTSLLTGSTPDLGGLDPQTGFTARCPGSGSVTAPDGSNDVVQDESACNTGQKRR